MIFHDFSPKHFKQLIMEKEIIYTPLKNTLSVFDKQIPLISYGAIVLKDIYYKMILGEVNKKILTGFKIYYLKSDLVFDIIVRITEMNQLPEMNETIAPIIHTFNYPEIGKPQGHLLNLNKQFPKITKAFVCFPGSNPHLKRLITNNSGYKMFIPASYILLDEIDYKIITN